MTLELFDVCPVAPADGGPLPPPFDGPVGFGDGLDDAGDDIFMIREQDEKQWRERKTFRFVLYICFQKFIEPSYWVDKQSYWKKFKTMSLK